MKSLLIEKILKTKKITDYLAKRGYHPIGGEVNGRLRYRCPLHDGDNTPSFMVYLNGEYENFFCFGCKARYNIIHLYKGLEKISTKEAIKKLGEDLEIDVEAEISFAVEQIQNDTSLRAEFSPPELALMVSKSIYDFLHIVNFDKSMVEKVEKINQLTDEALINGDINSLKILADTVPDKLAYLVKNVFSK